MILMWLGGFALMLYGLRESQKNWQALVPLKNFSPLLRIGLQASPERALYEGAVAYGYGLKPLRAALLVMSFSFLGAWLVFVLSALFAQIQGLVFLGVGSLMFLNQRHFQKLNSLFRLSFSIGLFLTGAELLMRQSAFLQSFLGDSEFAFWLVDGRAPAVLSLVGVGLALGLLLRAPFWSLILGLALLTSSTVSFAGALALFAGERLAQSLALLWRSRDFPQGQGILRRWSVCSGLGTVTGFFIVWYLKEVLGWGSSFGLNGAAGRLSQFLILAVVLLLVQGLFQLVGGHFLSREAPESDSRSGDKKPVPSWWFESGILDSQTWF